MYRYMYVKVHISPKLESVLAVEDVHGYVQAMTHVHVQYEISATNLKGVYTKTFL